MVKKQSLSIADIEKQESLTFSRVKDLYRSSDPESLFSQERPVANFIDLMNWAMGEFGNTLSNHDKLEKLIHNRIIIDGQFLTFCDENNIKVTCLYKDSTVSWLSDTGHEKFFMQGVFLVKKDNCEFLQCALFHKGNNNEDEVSFFVIVDHSSYEQYITLRNQFDTWVKARDRGTLHIRVVEGDDIVYTKNHNWNDLFLPNNIKNDIKNLVETFLSSKSFYEEKKLPWKRGFLMYGEPGNGKTSIIRTIMSNYDFKPVTIVPEANNEMVREAFAYAEAQSPSLLYFEDLDSLFDKGVDISMFLNLLDGISTKSGILVVATANNIKRLQSNITNRPSRFDRKFEIPLPDLNMTISYLNKWFGKSTTQAKIKELSKITVQSRFSYAYLKDLYISSMYEAIAHNRKIPTTRDIDNALKSLLRDKNLLNSGINTDNYLK